MSGQWRMGVAGPVSLDWLALPVVESRLGLPASKRREVFADLQLMQGVILRTWSEQRASARSRQQE